MNFQYFRFKKFRPVLLLGGCMLLSSGLWAQNSDVESQLQDLQEVVKMMRASGSSEEQIMQFETMMKGMIERDVAVKAAKKAQQNDAVSSTAYGSAGANGQSRGSSAPKAILPPEVSSGTLLLGAGGEVYEFNTAYCNANEYRTGNLIVEFDVTAIGMFRGRPAIAFLSKSRAAEFKQEFSDFDLYLGKLTEEQRQLAPWVVKQQLSEIGSSWEGQRHAELEAEYASKIHDDMPIEEVLKVMDEKSAKSKKFREEARAMTYPRAWQNQSEIEVEGQSAYHMAPGMITSDADRTPEFQNLGSATEVRVRCN